VLDVDFVITTHDEIISQIGGLPGLGSGGRAGIESALGRIENHAAYAGLDDVFGIASMYAVAIAQGHVFTDGNKRTGLTCALAYLEQQGIQIQRTSALEELMVDIAEHQLDKDGFANVLSAIWVQANP